MSDDALIELVGYVAKRPMRPPAYMARVLRQDPDELQIRLDAATRLGWLDAEMACCGRGLRYRVTDAGAAVLRENGG